ncbi:cystathionine beta-synthase [Okibacterium sp. HSC-33S16]|uniref:cystathionine beta-synthase n=1 Tax=Okibacterium sp. HSC-33S16 TaxID=2910965 RepID=UPI0020A1DD4D|nr:cystathionine beta-synthase [Okibacterium sp. HSC-33S16]MCP2032286.1 cystathionine beta-synthase [Okibacterium sp. HSC-33S16]
MKYAETIVDLVGNTPLIKLNSVTEGIAATVLAKVEYFNPGGSIKDRIATRIIDAAEASGDLKPGGTIVEPTSGNTGVGLALVAQQRGYKCIFVVPDKVGEEKRNVLTAYGAQVVVTPTSVTPESPESYYSVSDRLAAEIPGAFKPNQYFNQNGPLSHYETTGPEIWNDTDGTVSHVVMGVGTGGTITGTGRFLREVSNGGVRIIGADPEGSVYSGGTGRPYLVEGVGEDMWPGAYDPGVVDEVIAVNDAESFAMTRRLALEEGLLVGGSSGMAVVAALKAARSLPADAVVVVVLPDGGRGYLAKIFNDGWMRSHGFLGSASDERTVGDLVRSKDVSASSLVHARPTDTVSDVAALLSSTGLSRVPVLSAQPPVMLGEVVGSVSQASLLESILSGSATVTDAVSTVIEAPIPMIGAGESIEAARTALTASDALLVIEDGKPQAVITRQDLLTFVTE